MSDGPKAEPGSVHLVQFYEDDAVLTEAVARFVGRGLGAGDGAIVIATPPHRADIAARLAAFGLDLAAVQADGRYVALDAAETLASFMIDGRLDEARFADAVEGSVTRVWRGDGARVFAFGEMITLLWAAGQREAALRLEQLWSQVTRAQPVSLLCAYPIGVFGGEADVTPFLAVCREHSAVVPAESYTALAPGDEQSRAIAALQQKAHALEAEIAQRKSVEETLRQRNQTLRELIVDNARLYDAERRARGDAEAANRAKDQFLAMLGHELRNPLAAVQNAVVTARLDPLQRERALDIARRGADQLGRLVDDLLDVARITQGRIVLRTQRVPFAGIVERAVETVRSLIEERVHELTLSVPSADVQVDGDGTRLEQVVVNLLSNAAKYTDPGGHITVTAVQDAGEVVLRVRDDGIGIAPTMLPRVFDLFTQAERALDRAQGGLGIGLTVVRRLVELHRGQVEAHSEGLGKGAEFVVRLPAVVAVREPAAPPASVAVSAERVRILLVEDNVDAGESLGMLLGLLGHRVRVVSDGPSAIEAARANVPDVMLVDIGLPGMDGYEVARRVREERDLSRVTLVALTGYGRDEDRQRALAAGFDYHLVKPVNPDALEGLVARMPARAPRGTAVH